MGIGSELTALVLRQYLISDELRGSFLEFPAAVQEQLPRRSIDRETRLSGDDTLGDKKIEQGIDHGIGEVS
jgi:hypothetical protein